MAVTLLPGVYVQTVPPPVAETLPRMDIAAFIGFAASGPLNVPVMVEDIGQFENIFGTDYTLAWDRASGDPATAQLAPSVRSFFRNGGVRCWIVRVAADTAVTNTFTMPSLYSWDGANLTPATATARCEGSWSDDLVVETVLEQTPIALTDILILPGTNRLQPVQQAGQQVRLAAGDVIQIRTPQGLFGFMALGADLTADEALWFDQLAPAVAPDMWKPGYLASVVTFRVKAHGTGTLALELEGLGFSPLHDRYWAWLPTDAEIFRIPDWPQTPPAAGLRSDAANPRFPFAGTTRGVMYLPLGMPDFYNDDLAQGTQPGVGGLTALERDGLKSVTAGIFLDSDLAESSVESLLDQAFYKRFQAPNPQRLTGIHSLLEIDEVSLIAVPDASQRSFIRTTYTQAVLGAPVLSGGPNFTWTSVDGATKYLLDSYGQTLFEGPDTQFVWTVPTRACPARNCFRVRAENDEGYGPWSNTIVLERPVETFALCDVKPLPAPVLKLCQKLPLLEFSWNDVDADTYEIQRSTDPAFALSQTVFSSASKTLTAEIWAPSTGTSYFRMRAHRGADSSVWSNTAIYSATANYAWETDPADNTDGRSIDIQAALIRFCAARSDMFAVLHAPSGYNADLALAYESSLLAQFAGDSRSPGFAALYHPWTLNTDASSVVSGPQVPDGAMLGTYAARTLALGAWYAPANIVLKEAVAVDTPLDPAASSFFRSQINLIRQQPQGFVTMSSETLTDDPDFLEVNVRRLMILIRRLALREGVKDVFEPNDASFRRLVQRHFDSVLGDLFTRGAFAGATAAQSFRVVTDASVNTQQSLDAGRFIVELRVAPSEPLDFLIVRLLQTGSQVLVSEESAGGR